VKLTSKVAIALGMAVHEMGTNAAKYGALHGEHGSIAIRWMVVEDRLVIDWREKSGRAIEQPKHKGFGTQLIQQTIRNELEGTLSLKYESDGLHAVFTIPLSSQPTV
jgi:two-component sensor histidine kinase